VIICRQRRVSSGKAFLCLVIWLQLDALACCVKDQLRVDAYPHFAGLDRRPLADELQRSTRRQRPGPPP
jgi:hypothetical protein